MSQPSSRFQRTCFGFVSFLVCSTASDTLSESSDKTFSVIASQWEQEFEEFMSTPGRLGFHFTDLPEIREFESYRNLVSSEHKGIEKEMIEFCGEYPYTPSRLCMAIVICDRRGWDPYDSVRRYLPGWDRFRIPDAVKIRLEMVAADEAETDSATRNFTADREE